jgi:hypothetical protein
MFSKKDVTEGNIEGNIEGTGRQGIRRKQLLHYLNPLTPNDPYRGRTAPLTSKRFILYTYSTNIGTEYFKHGINSPFFSLQNAVGFIILTYLVPVLFTFNIQGVIKLKKNNSGAKMLMEREDTLN